LLDYSFPADNPAFPQAFSAETGDAVQILPDWLRLKMIRSTIERMVDVALQDLTPEQVILFIQSFGTPINSMSKLLALLDQAIVENVEAVKAVNMNITYLLQLIEIQQTRGAKYGHISMKYLRSIKEKIDYKIDPKKNEVVGKIDMLERYDPVKVKTKASAYRPGKFSNASNSFRVSSLLGDLVDEKETKPTIEISTEFLKSSKKLRLSDSGRNIHHTLSELLFSTHPFEIEIFAHRHLNFKNLKQSKLAHLINSMCVMLKDDAEKLSVNKTGIIVDWLVQFDSELIRTNQDVQISLLFGKGVQVYRPYFLSLLIHQANWSTIAMALEKLLNQVNSGIYDPTTVLEFVDAIIRNLKLWQGRDKAIPKHEQIEFVINLDESQTRAFIDYILKEEERLQVNF
jgi:integrator complex subunit 1